MSTSADVLRVQVRTLCCLGGQRVMPGERVLPRALAERAISDGMAVRCDAETTKKMSKKPQGMKL